VAASHNWLIREINRRSASRLAPLAHGELLDIGCGTKPYEEMFRPFVSQYVGLEHPATRGGREKVDVWGSADDLPFPDGSFDTVVALQVLEHCEDPAQVLAEAHRVLRPDGLVALTTPFLWPLHEAPRDFFRYTPYGLIHLLEQAGFEHAQVQPVCGYWTTAGLGFSYYLRRFRSGPWRPLVVAVQQVVQILAAVLDRADRRPESTAGYVTTGVRTRTAPPRAPRQRRSDRARSPSG
jgi:SAM-dependent methyltransferase